MLLKKLQFFKCCDGSKLNTIISSAVLRFPIIRQAEARVACLSLLVKLSLIKFFCNCNTFYIDVNRNFYQLVFSFINWENIEASFLKELLWAGIEVSTDSNKKKYRIRFNSASNFLSFFYFQLWKMFSRITDTHWVVYA